MGSSLTKRQIRQARSATVYLQNMDKAVSRMKQIEAALDIALFEAAFLRNIQNHTLRVYSDGMKPISVAGGE